MARSKKNYISYLALLSAGLFLGMGGGEQSSTALMPAFVALQDGEGTYSGTIKDGDTTFKVHDISFSGVTRLEGVRIEGQDSTNVFKLEKVRSVTITDKNYTVQGTEMVYTKADIKLAKGGVIRNVLIPRMLTVCAIETATDLEKAWSINKLDTIVITGMYLAEPMKMAIPTETDDPSRRFAPQDDPSTRLLTQSAQDESHGSHAEPSSDVSKYESDDESLIEQAREAGQKVVGVVTNTGKAIVRGVKRVATSLSSE